MTTSPPSSTELAWQKLKLGDSVGEFPVSTIKLELDAGHGPVRLGLGNDGAPQLLVPLPNGRRIPDGLSGVSVTVHGVQYLVDGRHQNFIEVRSTVRDLDDVFRRLVDEVIGRLMRGTAPELAVSQAINDLRDLLRKERNPDIEFLIGLFGELSILETLLQHNPEASRCWTGPIPQRYDFSGRKACAEVKSSLRHGARIVKISSVAQLTSPTDNRTLYLLYFLLERTGAGGRTIAGLIDSIRSLSMDPSYIDESVNRLGLEMWRQLPSLNDERFGTIEIHAYRVEPGFPRLTRSSFVDGEIPTGVSNIQYEVDLFHARAFRLDEPLVRDALHELSGVQ